jgi:hypothetical protein
MTIREPMTMATDYLLALVAFFGAARLLLASRERPSARPWGVGLILSGLAAAVGGSMHGFAAYLSPGTKAALWQVIYMLVGVASFLVLAGALRALTPDPPRRGLLVASSIKLGVYVVWMTLWPSMRYAMIDYVVAMLAVLVLLVLRRGSAGVADGVASILVGFGAAFLQQAHVSFHEHFNHNDLSHVVQCVSLWLLARAGRELRDLG